MPPGPPGSAAPVNALISRVLYIFRIDWDKHKITADHMYKVEQEAAENNVIPKQGLEYYEPFEVRNAFKTKIPKDERKVEDTKNMEMEDDPYEIDRIQESAKLTLKKIGTYEIPTFDETKMIGKYLTFISFYLCSLGWFLNFRFRFN